MALDSDPQIDWRSRADGGTHVLIRGKHYTRPESKVRHAATVWGARNALRALSELHPDGISIRFVTREGKV